MNVDEHCIFLLFSVDWLLGQMGSVSNCVALLTQRWTCFFKGGFYWFQICQNVFPDGVAADC